MGSGASKNSISFRQRAQMIGVMQSQQRKSVPGDSKEPIKADSPAPSLILDNPDSRNPMVRETARKWYHNTQIKFEDTTGENGTLPSPHGDDSAQESYDSIKRSPTVADTSAATIMIRELCRIRTNKLKIEDFKKIKRRKAVGEQDNLSIDVPYDPEPKVSDGGRNF